MIISITLVPDSSPLDDVEDEMDLAAKKRKTATPSSDHRPTTRTPVVTLQGHAQPATAVMWVEQNEIVSAGWDMCIKVWDVTTGGNVTTLVYTVFNNNNCCHNIAWVLCAYYIHLFQN